MSLNKKTMVREIGRRTRLNNRDVERVIETLVEVWTEELVSGGRIEIEHFVVIDAQRIGPVGKSLLPKQAGRKIRVRMSKFLRNKIREEE